MESAFRRALVDQRTLTLGEAVHSVDRVSRHGSYVAFLQQIALS